MPDGEISDEDRERLVEAKFADLFNKNFERVFSEAFDKRVTEMTAQSKKAQAGRSPSTPSAADDQHGGTQAPSKPRRSSLLDKALGIG